MSSRIQHVKYIKASKDALWAALIDPLETRKYFLQHGQIESDFQPGASLKYVSEDSGEPTTLASGDVVRAQPGRELTYTFAFADTDDAPSQVSWKIDSFGQNYVKLTLTHQKLEDGSETHKRMKNSRSLLLCRLQTLLESGAHGWQ